MPLPGPVAAGVPTVYALFFISAALVRGLVDGPLAPLLFLVVTAVVYAVGVAIVAGDPWVAGQLQQCCCSSAWPRPRGR